MADTIRDTVILGSGCSGLTAAIYTSRANLKPLVLEGHEPGGQLSITTLVENFPGFPDGIQGPQLVENMKLQATRFGAEFQMSHLASADLSKRPFALRVGPETIHTRTLIIASGASARWLGLPSEQALIGHGVSSCATCDGFFFTGKEIAVVGGGDSAMEEALFLTRFASQVYVVHRRDTLRASKIMQQRALANEKIAFVWNSAVTGISGKSRVEGIHLRDTVTGDERRLAVGGVFVAIGNDPRVHLVHGQLDLTIDGTIAVRGRSSRTNLAGVFAAGDVIDPHYRQAITAAGSGAVAALDAEQYLAALDDATDNALQPATT